MKESRTSKENYKAKKVKTWNNPSSAHTVDEYENLPEGESRAPRLSTELKVRFRAEIACKPVHFRSQLSLNLLD
jgi:hypothetical protein